MSRKSRADRVAAGRAAAQLDAENTRREAEAAARRAFITSLRDEADVLIPKALGRLEARGYPGIEQVDVIVPCRGPRRLWNRGRMASSGAYRVFKYSYARSDWPLAGSEYVRLLSSGRIRVGVSSYSLSEFVKRVLDHEGLGEPGHSIPKAPFTTADLAGVVSGLRTLAENDGDRQTGR